MIKALSLNNSTRLVIAAATLTATMIVGFAVGTKVNVADASWDGSCVYDNNADYFSFWECFPLTGTSYNKKSNWSRHVQSAMHNWGFFAGIGGSYNQEVDGWFGTKTKNAVKAYQTYMNLWPIDGIVGPVTYYWMQRYPTNNDACKPGYGTDIVCFYSAPGRSGIQSAKYTWTWSRGPNWHIWDKGDYCYFIAGPTRVECAGP